ncbi:hypothetical protein LOK49_LG15G02068 [Camellia lanceoleosa]|uniref:Uncharacterized protein n=1 Tax=Camellia lanceoleosa TaxID=1840588 RepID=A0ACC0F2Z2_9ERIC|nr:hypothetical protein LOK49_LG15G02068 [Camellia lanceoleosa]
MMKKLIQGFQDIIKMLLWFSLCDRRWDPKPRSSPPKKPQSRTTLSTNYLSPSTANRSSSPPSPAPPGDPPPSSVSPSPDLTMPSSQMPRHLISDAHEWINEIPTVPVYYPAKPQPRERAWQNQRGKKTLLSLTLVQLCEMT